MALFTVLGEQHEVCYCRREWREDKALGSVRNRCGTERSSVGVTRTMGTRAQVGQRTYSANKLFGIFFTWGVKMNLNWSSSNIVNEFNYPSNLCSYYSKLRTSTRRLPKGIHMSKSGTAVGTTLLLQLEIWSNEAKETYKCGGYSVMSANSYIWVIQNHAWWADIWQERRLLLYT